MLWYFSCDYTICFWRLGIRVGREFLFESVLDTIDVGGQLTMVCNDRLEIITYMLLKHPIGSNMRLALVPKSLFAVLQLNAARRRST